MLTLQDPKPRSNWATYAALSTTTKHDIESDVH